MNGIRAYLLTASERQTLQAYPDGALAWDDQGTFCYAGPWSERPEKPSVVWEELRHLIVTPGFIDVHSHLPQYPAVGIGGYPLLPWLEKFIFPVEQKFAPECAGIEAPQFFNELKQNGITSAVIYTTDNPESTDICFQAAKASGLRVAMGQMLMDINCPRASREKQLTNRALDESAALCARWHNADDGRDKDEDSSLPKFEPVFGKRRHELSENVRVRSRRRIGKRCRRRPGVEPVGGDESGDLQPPDARCVRSG